MAAIFDEEMMKQMENVYGELKKKCLAIFEKGRGINVSEVATALMDTEGVPMHFPYHHFIIPATFLIAVSIEKDVEKEEFVRMLELVLERSKDVPGGSCGNMGACGACVGAGIFMSVFTGASPMSGRVWGWANELTGRCLVALSKYEGPRCCKRAVYVVIEEAVPYINENLGVELKYEKNLKCKYFSQNKECKRKKCPFYPEKMPILVPQIVMPKKDEENPCPCQDIPVKLEYKTCCLSWLYDIGDYVEKGQVICEGEVEKKAFGIQAPCSGYIAEKCLDDEDDFTAGDILGYIKQK